MGGDLSYIQSLSYFDQLQPREDKCFPKTRGRPKKKLIVPSHISCHKVEKKFKYSEMNENFNQMNHSTRRKNKRKNLINSLKQ